MAEPVSIAHPESAGAIRAPKLASVVARRIEDEIVASGWPVGEVLGSEIDLLDRFGVSRAVLREAVRIIEHTGAARMRRGPGGGLVVSAPNRGAVVAGMGVWFSYIGATIAELIEARRPLLLSACRLAAERADAAGIETLFARIEEAEATGTATSDHVRAIEAAIAAMAKNTALALFIDSLADVGVNRMATGRARLEPALTDAEGAIHVAGYRRLAEAIATGDADDAQRRSSRLIDALADRLQDARRRARGQDLPPGGKLAERVATALRLDIERASWPVGQVLGSETELINRYGVSRAILREAVRILEHHGAVRTKRGPHGGVIVTAPAGDAIVRSAGVVLAYERLTAAQLFEARVAVEGSAVRLAAERCTPAAAAELHGALTAEAGVMDPVVRFMPLHYRVAAATGNRLLELFVDIISELVPIQMPAEQHAPGNAQVIADGTRRAHARIVEAILAGDPEIAERRMLRHLRASVDVLRKI